MKPNLSFRWLGVQGVELRCKEQTLVIDPFFTRPPLTAMLLLRPVQPDRELILRMVPACSYILVTHSHYDHLMDVPDLARHTGATVFGSANTGQILDLSGVPGSQFHQVQPGERLNLGPFEVEVFANHHVSLLAAGTIFNGPIRPGLRPPLRQVDYRMDRPFGFYIQAQGVRILVCPGPARPADVLLAGVDWKEGYYRSLLAATRPRLFVPLHWDNFFRSLEQPLRELVRPTGLSLKRLAGLMAEAAPTTKFRVPSIFERLNLIELISEPAEGPHAPS
jgi:L-ascorbate metabolism protein UlaG (beta-lactamase superfamily)